jgi:hypothetical protein
LEKELSQTYELALKHMELEAAYLYTVPKHMFNDKLLFYITSIIVLLVGGGRYVYGKNQEKRRPKKKV